MPELMPPLFPAVQALPALPPLDSLPEADMIAAILAQPPEPAGYPEGLGCFEIRGLPAAALGPDCLALAVGYEQHLDYRVRPTRRTMTLRVIAAFRRPDSRRPEWRETSIPLEKVWKTP